MTTTVHISADQDTAYLANISDTEWVLDEGVTIHTTANYVSALVAAGYQSDRHFEIRGNLISDTQAGFVLGGASDSQVPNSVHISELGHIQGLYGLFVYGAESVVVNDGTIEATTGVSFGEEGGYFENNGSIHSTFMGISSYNEDLHVVNSGEIAADQNAAIWSTGSNVLIENINNGKISSSGASAEAIYVSGSGSVLHNEGSIEAFYGVRLHDDNITATNSGMIVGSDTGIMIDLNSKNTEIANSGTISGGSFSIVDQAGEVNVVNTGILVGDVSLGAGADRFENKGTAENIFLGEGDDVFVLRSGSCGTIDGGGGDDVYRLSKSVKIAEDSTGGSDTVFAGLAWTLGANFENLTLAGRHNISGTGNELDNLIKGNRGENRLAGLSGDDQLTGGGGTDIFVYETGGGADTITDFRNGTDRLDLSGWSAITSYADLMAHHISVAGDDLIIHAGSGKLTLLDTDRAELDASDFIF